MYLAQRGFNVTAIDTNPAAIDMLKSTSLEENMSNVKAQVYDINDASLGEDYSFISCTVTFPYSK